VQIRHCKLHSALLQLKAGRSRDQVARGSSLRALLRPIGTGNISIMQQDSSRASLVILTADYNNPAVFCSRARFLTTLCLAPDGSTRGAAAGAGSGTTARAAAEAACPGGVAWPEGGVKLHQFTSKNSHTHQFAISCCDRRAIQYSFFCDRRGQIALLLSSSSLAEESAHAPQRMDGLSVTARDRGDVTGRHGTLGQLRCEVAAPFGPP
jgi:hypothetical protein